MKQLSFFKLDTSKVAWSEDSESFQVESTSGMIAILLQLIYQIYDSGGISARRSTRSVLLELAKTLHRPNASYRRFESDDFLVMTRLETLEPKQPCLWSYGELEELFDSQVVYLLLRELFIHYEELEQRSEWKGEYLESFEAKLLEIALALFPITTQETKTISREAIYEEARNRERKLLEEMMRDRDRRVFGIGWNDYS